MADVKLGTLFLDLELRSQQVAGEATKVAADLDRVGVAANRSGVSVGGLKAAIVTMATQNVAAIDRIIRLVEEQGKEVDTTSAKSVAGFKHAADAAAAYAVKLGATDQQLDRIGAAIQGVEARAAKGATGLGLMGTSGQRAALGIVSGFESMARQGEISINSLKTGVGSLAATLGSGGILFAAISFATTAVIDLFVRAAEASHDARVRIIDDLVAIRREKNLQSAADAANLLLEGDSVLTRENNVEKAEGNEARLNKLEAERKGVVALRKEIADLEKQLRETPTPKFEIVPEGNPALVGTAGKVAQLNTDLANAKAQLASIEQQSTEANARSLELTKEEFRLNQLSRELSSRADEINNLSRIIALGKANNDQLARAATLVKDLRGELAKLPAGADDERATRLEQISRLTKPFRPAIAAANQGESIDDQVTRFGLNLDQVAAGQSADRGLDDITAKFAKLGETLDELGDKAQKSLLELRKTGASPIAVAEAGAAIAKIGALGDRLDTLRETAVALERVKIGERLQLAIANLSTTGVDNLRVSLQQLERTLTESGADPAFIAQVKQANIELLATAQKSEDLEKRIAQLREDGVKPLTAVSELLRRRGEEETRLFQLQKVGVEGDRERVVVHQNIAVIDGEIAKRTQENAQHLQAATTASSHLFGNMAKIANVAFGAASAVLGVDNALTRSVGSAAQLFEGIQDVRDAAKTAGGFSKLFNTGAGLASALPGIGQIVGGGAALVSAISGALGDSPADLARREQTQRLVDALDKLRGAVGDLANTTLSGRQIGAAQRAVAGVRIDDLEGKPGVLANTAAEIRLRQSLKRNGTSREDLEALTGVDLSGPIGVEQIKLLKQALAELDLKKFAADFGSQLSALETEFELFDVDDPIDRIKGFIALLSDERFGAPALAKALSALDLGTLEGRQSATEVIQRYYQKLKDGSITLEELNGLSPQEFLDSLKRIEAGLDEATIAATAFADASSKLSAEFDINDIEDPTEQFTRTAAKFSELSPALKALFDGIDVSTRDGIERAKARTRELFARNERGELTESERGGLSQEDFRAKLLEADKFFDAIFGAMVDKAAEARRRILSDADAELGFNDVDAPLDQLKAKVAAFAKAFPEFAAALEGLDLSTPDGLAQFDQVIRDLYESGKAGAEALGLTEAEFAAFIAALFGLESASDSAASAVESLADTLNKEFSAIDLEGRVFGRSDAETTKAKLSAFGLGNADLSTKAGRDAVISTLQAAFSAATEDSQRQLIASLIDNIRGLGDDVADAVSSGDRGGSTDVRGTLATFSVQQADVLIGIQTSALQSQIRAERYLQQIVAGVLRAAPVITAPPVTLPAPVFATVGRTSAALGETGGSRSVVVHQHNAFYGPISGIGDITAILQAHEKQIGEIADRALGRSMIELAVNAGNRTFPR